MHRQSPLPLLTLMASLLVAALALIPGRAEAQRSPAATDACFTQLQENYGADEMLKVTQRRNNGVRFVHMSTRLQDGRVINYRCIVRNNSVRKVQSYDGSWDTAEPVERIEEPEAPQDADATAEAEGEEEAEGTEEAEGEAAEADEADDGETESAEATREIHRPNLGDSFSPTPGLTCYRKRGACFDENGNLNIAATSRQFPSQ